MSDDVDPRFVALCEQSVKDAARIAELEGEIERLRAALKEVIADVNGHNLLKQRQSKHDDVLTWVSVAHARKALKGETNEGSTK